jgi:hypothetical protein
MAKMAIMGDFKTLIKLFRGLFNTPEPFYVISRECQTLISCYKILIKIRDNEQINKHL